MLDRHLRSASGRGRCSFDDDSGQRGAIFRYTRRCGRRGDHGAVRFVSLVMEMFLPGTLQAALGKWIPFNAGSQIWSTVSVPSAHQFSPWAGFTVFTACAAAALRAALVLFLQRDA